MFKLWCERGISLDVLDRQPLFGKGPGAGVGGGYLGHFFAGYVPLTSQNPNPIIVYSVANHRLHVNHF